jgi:hypothetical protein
MYDFSDAEASNGDFDLLPAGLTACVTTTVKAGDEDTPENAFKRTSTGLLMLQLEFTITETEDGKYVGRKFWQNLILGAVKGTQLTDGQEKAINIAKGTMRQILEAGRGYAPTDESEAAINARKFDSVFELDGLEFWIDVGVEKSKDPQYSDKNKIKKVHAVAGADETEKVAPKTAAKPAVAKPAAGKPAASKAPGGAPKRPNWS